MYTQERTVPFRLTILQCFTLPNWLCAWRSTVAFPRSSNDNKHLLLSEFKIFQTLDPVANSILHGFDILQIWCCALGWISLMRGRLATLSDFNTYWVPQTNPRLPKVEVLILFSIYQPQAQQNPQVHCTSNHQKKSKSHIYACGTVFSEVSFTWEIKQPDFSVSLNSQFLISPTYPTEVIGGTSTSVWPALWITRWTASFTVFLLPRNTLRMPILKSHEQYHSRVPNCILASKKRLWSL